MNKLKIFLKALGLCSAILIILAISYLHIFETYELESLDLRFQLRPNPPVTDKIVIIEIGQDTIKYLGRFPFDRDYHAVITRALTEFGAKAVVFDIFFSEPHATDREFEEALKTSGNVYLPSVFELNAGSGKIPTARAYAGQCLESFLTFARGSGHINVIPDLDGKYRRIPVYIQYGNTFYPQLTVLVALDHLGIKQKDVDLVPGRYLQCGKDLKIPLDEDSLMLINYSGKWGTVYKHYSYVDLLRSYFANAKGEKPIIDPAVFKDKVCIIGLTADGTVDIHPTPLENVYPAVGVHPEIFNSIINKSFISRVSRQTNLVILAILGLFIAFMTMRLKPLKSFFILVSTVIIYCLVLIMLFSLRGLWVDMVCPVAAMIGVYLAFTLYKYVAEWKKRLVMERELDIARKIQQSFLPKRLPSVEGFDISAVMMTARQVGGDIYDFVEFDSGHLGVMIGDVSGKGIPASLFMSMVAGFFKFLSAPTLAPESVLFNLNAKLVKENASNLFVTVFYAVFDLKERVMSYANGGHLPLLYAASGKGCEFLDVEEGTPLGLMEGNYSGRKIGFGKGDIFVFYTDGVTEAMNNKGDMYEKERLVKVVESNRDKPAEDLVKAIEKDLRRFEPVANQHDDITIIAVRMI